MTTPEQEYRLQAKPLPRQRHEADLDLAEVGRLEIERVRRITSRILDHLALPKVTR